MNDDPECPNLADLLRARRGELPAEQTRAVSAHVQTCLECQTRLGSALGEDREDTSAADRDLGDTPSESWQPLFEQRPDVSPTSPASDVLSLMSASGGHRTSDPDPPSIGRSEEEHASRHALRWRAWTWRIARIAALIVMCLVLGTHETVLDANSCVQRVVRAEAINHLSESDQLLMRFTDISPHGSADTHAIVLSHGHGPSARDLPQRYAAALSTIGISLDRLLSIVPLVAWQDLGVRRKEASGWTLRPKGRWLALTATASQGLLRQADMRIDPEADRVVSMTLTLDEVGVVEILDATRATWLSKSHVASAPPEAASGAASGAVSATLPTSDDLDRAELNGRVVLAQTGLDMLLRDLDISRTREAVHIAGIIMPSRQDATESLAQLRGVEHVSVSVKAPAVRTSDAAASLSPALAIWSTRTFGDATTARSFVPALTASLGTVRQRLSILDALARRYPERPTGSATEPLALQQLIEVHYDRQRMELDDLRKRLSVLAGTPTVVQPSSELPRQWLQRAPAAYQRATKLEQHLHALLSRRDVTPAAQRRVRGEFERLWRSVYGSRPQHP